MTTASLDRQDQKPLATRRRYDVMVDILSRPAVFGGMMPAVTILNAIVGMILPKLMTPYVFGSYSLVVTLFQYGLIFDLGGSQLVDRAIPVFLGSGQPEKAERRGQQLLWLRLYVAVGTLAVAIPGLLILSAIGDLPFPVGAGVLATFAGIAYMVALGPACLYRAGSARRNYAISAVALSLGLVVARPAGLMLGGMMGCFAALAAWYVGFGLLFLGRSAPRISMRPGIRQSAILLSSGLPFFLTSFIWAFYVTGNRWFGSGLIPSSEFGEFGFASNIFSLLVGAIGGFSAFYYPRLTERIARGGAFAMSRRLWRDCSLLVAGIAAIMVVGVLLAADLVRFLYPQYAMGVSAARIMLVAVPPVVLASWLMPISLSNGKHPWIDGVVIFPVATLVLGLAVHRMFHLFGVDGVAAASTISAVPLVAMQLAALWHARVLTAWHSLGLLLVTVLASGVLGCLVVWMAL